MANLALAFNLSASATGMAQGINAGVVELQKLGYAAKQTASDVSTLKTIEISRVFVSGINGLVSVFGKAQNALSGFVNDSVAIGEAAQRSVIVFGDAAKQIQEFAVSSASIGLSEKAAIQAATRFGTLFTTIGLGKDVAADYSQTLVQLASDLASFSDTTVDDAITALSSALVGEFEPIRRYGVLLNEATLKQTAIANGMRATTGALDPQTKLVASYLQILRQTTKQQGDFVRTSDQLANQQRILRAEWSNISAAIGGALQPVYRSFIAGLRESLPQIKATALEIASFIQGIDFGRVISAAIISFKGFAAALSATLVIASPLASNILPAIGGYLAFINRQAIAGGIANLARYFAAAATSTAAYTGAAGAATVATAGFAASVRALLASTGIGALAVVLGLAAGALIEWSIAGGQAGPDVEQAIAKATAETKKFTAQTQLAIGGAQQFGEKIKEALKVPESISAREFAEGALGEARSAIVSLAKELGGLNNIPAPLIAEFDELLKYSRQIAENKPNSIDFVSAAQGAGTLTEAVKKLSDARKADADRIKEANEAARKANEDAKKRVDELRSSTLTDAEKSRLTLNQDLEAIARNIAAIEQEAGAARQRFDLAAMLAAEERLKIAQAEGKVLGDAAREQDRQRRLQARGIDVNLLKPVQTVADQMQAVRDAFNAGDIDQNQFVQGLRNLAAEGIKIRQDIAAELARPAERALNVADIRTTEGMAALLGYQRQDPAIEQRRAQLQKLDEIKRAVEANGVKAAEIIGG